MLAPQFTLKRLLAGVTVSAVICLVVAAAARGQMWAAALLLALSGVFVVLVVHGFLFLLIQAIARAFRRRRAPAAERIPAAR